MHIICCINDLIRKHAILILVTKEMSLSGREEVKDNDTKYMATHGYI